MLLIGALFVRVGWVLHLPVDEASIRILPDQAEYLELGRNLLHQHELKFHDDRFDQDIRAYRTPGYPILVAMCGGNVRAIRIVQALLDTSTVLATYLLARRWLGERACLFAALVVAVNPFLIYFTGLVLSETLFIALLAWGMALLGRSIIAAILFALSIYVRPSALLLPVLLAVLVARVFNPCSGRGAGWKPVLQVVIAILVALVPWAIRNKNQLGQTIWTTTNSGITMYDGFNPQADGSSNQSFVTRMPELKQMDEIERTKYLSKLAREFIKQNPGTALKLAILKIARTWSPVPLSSEYGSRRMYVAVAACYSIPLDLLVIWGLWSGSLRRSAKVFLMMPALYFTLAHAISVGSLRYRIPVEVPMAVVVASCKLLVARGVAQQEDNSQLTTNN
jgi:4-amino-4-deoxy-L-arabinose transferase-like glycosyltransferase